MARKLRRNGWSIRAITKETSCAKSSVSLWVRDIEITPIQATRLKANMSHGSGRKDFNTCTACGKEYPVVKRQCGCKQHSYKCRHCGRQRRSGRLCDCRPSRKCRLCGKKHRVNSSRCASCVTKLRRIRGKMTAITYLGGKCQNPHCPAHGRKVHPAGFEFHHLDGKDFEIGSVHNRKWEAIKKELDKCILLCSICHRICHSTRFEDEVFIREAQSLGSGFDPEIDWDLLENSRSCPGLGTEAVCEKVLDVHQAKQPTAIAYDRQLVDLVGAHGSERL